MVGRLVALLACLVTSLASQHARVEAPPGKQDLWAARMFLWVLGHRGAGGQGSPTSPRALPSKFAGLLSTTEDRVDRTDRAVKDRVAAVDRMLEEQAEGSGDSQLAVLGNQANLPTWLMRQFTREARFRRGRRAAGGW